MRKYYPMELLKLLYGYVGAPYPILSLISVMILTSVGVGGIWWLIGREYAKENPVVVESPFQASIMATFRSDRREVGSGFWMGSLTGDNYTISPANVALSLRITNKQVHPVMLAGIAIESKTSDENWVKLIRLSTFGRDIYRIADDNFSSATLLQLDLLDQLLFNRSVEPHIPITGFVLLEYPEVSTDATFLNQFRATITDIDGAEFAIELENTATVEPSDTLQASIIKLIETRDLSQARRKVYSE